MRPRRLNHNSTHPPSETRNYAAPDIRRRRPSKGIHNDNNRNVNPSATTASKNLVMEHVKILKRGEDFNESLTILKEVNNRKLSDSTAYNTETADQENSKATIGSPRVTPKKKKAEKEKMVSLSDSNIEASKAEELVLSSLHRLGPDPEVVSKQMKNIRECFAGSVLFDSPPPSSVPLPGFFRSGRKDDATTELRRILGLSLC